MNHDQAIREQAVERYLLGELAEDARARFEEHFFDCAICAADLKTGAIFVDALRAERSLLPRQQPNIHLVAEAYRCAMATSVASAGLGRFALGRRLPEHPGIARYATGRYRRPGARQ